MSLPEEQEIVGLPEIAILLSVAPGTPATWAMRGKLPDPDYPPVNSLRTWRRSTIEEWAHRTGRMPKGVN